MSRKRIKSRYYTQAAGGIRELMHRREDVEWLRTERHLRLADVARKEAQR